MTFRETFYNVKRLMESRLHDFGLESADADTMGWTTMLSIEQNTNLTIDVPLNLIYNDNFNISGVLETSTFSRLANKTIKLKVGNTVVDNTTTNNYGEYSFTRAPVSMGNHTFQVIFEGTNIHGASTSPTVTRDILRETTILNASVNLNVISGTLISDDFEQTNEVLSNATIKIYENNSLIGSTTTDNLGRFSYTYDGASIDTTLTLEYEQTENYTGSTKDVHVVIYDSISLSTDKSILSYSDGESATLTAQLLNNGSNVNVSGISIDFLIYNEDNTLLDTLIASTDNNGVATVSYYSQGTGNIYIKATTSNIFSNNIQIENLYLHILGLTNQINKFETNITVLNNNHATITYDNDNKQYILTKTNFNGLVNIPITNLSGLSDIIIEFDAYLPSNSNTLNMGLAIDNIGFHQLGGYNNDDHIANIYNNGDNLIGNRIHYDDEWIHHKFIIFDNKVIWTGMRNGTEIINTSYNVNINSNTKIGLNIGYRTNAYGYIKNIKVKSL